MIAWLAIAALAPAAAQQAAGPAESRRAAAQSVEPEVPRDDGLDVFALFQTRASANDLSSTNPLLDGQVVGNIGGTNGVVVDPEATALYTEQRVGAFFGWKPPVLDGKASLHAAFEVDLAFGDAAYGVGGNTGGGFGADQVNLQTRRLHADLYPWLPGHDMHLVVGLQFVADGVADPSTSTPDGLIRSGGRLMLFGSEAAGVALYGRLHDGWGTRLRYRLGAFTLLEQGMGVADDVLLTVGDLEWQPTYATAVGLHAWYVQDRSGGTGGVLGVGPSSGLSELQGGPLLDPYAGYVRPEGARTDADLLWVGGDLGYNAALGHGPAGLHAVALANLGKMYAPIAHDDPVSGVIFDAEGRVRWAQGEGSVARVEALYTSGDDADPDRYTGVLTGNAYGVAGALYPSHGTLLLFPDPRSINRMVAVVSDVSAAGRGVLGLTGSLGYDPVPDRLTATIGAGHATAADGSGHLGTELNAHLVGEPLLFLNLGLHAAVVTPGPASGLTETPWMVYGSMDWLVFQ